MVMIIISFKFTGWKAELESVRARKVMIIDEFFNSIYTLFFTGRHIDGIWHTGIVVYNQEFFYGGTSGIESCPPVGISFIEHWTISL